MAIELDLPADHAAFDGHFPGVPILPAVVQVDWAVQLADAQLGLGLGGAPVFRIKCQRVITPPGPVVLTLRLNRAAGWLDFSYAIDGVTASSGRIALPAA